MQTTFINKRKRLVRIWEADGAALQTLYPDDRFELETDDPRATFARFSEVVFVPGPAWVRLTPQPGFSEPQRRWPCTMVLVDGGEDGYEVPLYGQPPLRLMRGVPVVVDLNLLDPLVVCERVEFGRKVMHKRPSDYIFGLVAYTDVSEPVKTLRPLADVEAIQRELEALTPEPAKSDEVEQRTC